MSKTREYGSGSIQERSPGVFLLRVYLPADPVTGEQRRVSKTVRGTRKEANAVLSKMVTESERNMDPTAMTVRDVVNKYYETTFLKKGTKGNYDRAWKEVPAHFASRKAGTVTVDDVSSLYKHLYDSGMSANYVRQLDIMLKAAYNSQRRRFSVNPCVGANKPEIQKKAIILPPESAVIRLLDLVSDWTEMVLWLRLLLVTGSRRGESLALRWSDVLWENNLLRIEDQIDAAGNVVSTTKTSKERTVHIDSDTMDLLLDWRDEQAEIAEAAGVTMVPDPWVFSRDKAGAIPKRGDSMYQRFKRYAAKAGISYASPHRFRHYMVSHALDSGENVEVVRKIVGHSSSTVTLNVYASTVTGADRMAVNRIASRVPMPSRSRGRSPFDDREALATAIACNISRAAILGALGLSAAQKNYERLEQRAAAFGLTLPGRAGAA